MNEVLQKELEKNYSKVQKKDLQVKDNSEILLNGYNKKVKDFAATVKADNKDYTAVDKKIKDEHKGALKSIKDAYKDNASVIASNVKDANKKYEDDIAKADAKNLKEVTKQEGLIEKANNAFDKENDKVLKDYEKSVEDTNKDIEKINGTFAADSEKLQEKLNDRKAKYDEKVAALNEKRDAKVAKFNETSQKKIEKLNEDINKQRAKTDKQVADLVPIYDEKMAEVNGLINEEKEEHENKAGNINSTLDSKVSRRNKFLEKAENENDTKAAKQQRKEIKQLQQNADRELKILQKAHEDRNKDLSAKKREINKNNLENVAAIEREFTSFKEDNLMQIELNKVALSDDITKTKLDTELKLLDELSKFDEFQSKHADNVANVLEKKDKAIQEQEDILVKFLVEFDKTNEINAAKHIEELAARDKELQIAAITKDSDYSLAKNALDVKIAKLDAEKDILDKKLDQDVLVNEENELLKYHRNDYDKQASGKTEFLLSQQALCEMAQERSKDVLDFEELEIENRSGLKVRFLEEQRIRIEKDYAELKGRIEHAFGVEEARFEGEIAAVAAKDKEAMIEFKNIKEEEIQQLVDEKKELDPQADKRRIKDLSDLINVKKSEVSADLKQKEDAISVKTIIFQKNLDLAIARKELALQEAKDMFEFENNDVTYAIELVNQNRDAELQEIKARYAKSLQNANNFINLSTNRNAKTTEENTQYLQDREDKENAIIDDAKALFEQLKNDLTNDKDAKLVQLESDKAALIERIKSESLAQEEKLEGIIADVARQVSQAEAKATQRLSVQSSENTVKIKEIESILKSELTRLANDLRIKGNRYKDAVAQIDKKADVEKKTYETEQARVQKEYDIELKKAITNINSKMDADIKAL